MLLVNKDCFLIIFTIWSLYLASSCHGQSINSTSNTPTTTQRNPLNSRCGPNSDRFCYAQEALNFILFGDPNKDRPITPWYDILIDSTTLDGMISDAIGIGLYELGKEPGKPGKYNTQQC